MNSGDSGDQQSDRHSDKPDSLLLISPDGERLIDSSRLPVQIGSHASADIRVPGAAGAATLATIGLLDGNAILQVTAAGITLNGDAAAGMCRLHDTDLLEYSGVTIAVNESAGQWRFTVDYTDVEYQTLPPDPAAESPQAAGAISPVRRKGGGRSAGDGGDEGEGKRNALLSVSGLGLAVLALFAFYIFTARSVGIDVDPGLAEVDVSGGLFRLQIDDRFLLRKGDYTVRLSAEGYYPEEYAITVGDEAAQDFDYVLRKKPGRLKVVLPEPAIASIWVDDQLMATVAGEEIELEPGLHKVRIKAERYLDFVSEVEIEGAGRLQELQPQLLPGWGDVTVTTQPGGSSVLVGGEVLGTAPGMVEIMAGTVALEIRKPGYKTWRQSLVVQAGQAQELPPITLREIEGVVQVTTQPPGAVITVDGEYQGVAPLEIELDKGATYRVKASKPGFDTASRSIEIKKSGEQTLSLTLKAQTGVVTVVANYPDAELLVDGRSQGSANRTLTLTAVPHRLEVRKPGFETFSTEVTPKPGLPQQLDVRLLTPEEAVLAATPKVLRTSLGAELRLVRPGSFTMGSKRREQGRRANEVQREVRLTRPFYIGVREVTNKEYRQFNATHTSGAERYRELSADSHPAVMMSWDEAARFCNWLSDQDGLPRAYITGSSGLRLADPPNNGYRLPTEAEWTWVARYNAGGRSNKYPWGDNMPPSGSTGNYADRAADGFVSNTLRNYEDGYPVTAPTGRFDPSPLGVYDLGGNVAEWVSDIYAISPAKPGLVEVNPTGAVSGSYRVIRGSSWRHSGIGELRYAFRDFGNKGRLDVGFRLARYTDAVVDEAAVD